MAVSQCSTRIGRPSTGWSALATSPAAYTCGPEVRSLSSTLMPLSSTRPAASASSTTGVDPDADHQVGRRSTSLPSPRVSTAPLAGSLMAATVTDVRRSTPCSRCRSANTVATSGPSTRTSGSSSASSTTTPARRSRAAEATSSPIQPPPMIAMLALARSCRAGGGVLDGPQVGDRHTAVVGHREVPGLGAGRQQQLVVGEVCLRRRRTVCRPCRWTSTRLSVRRSTSCSAYHSGVCTNDLLGRVLALEVALDSGGRSYGAVRLVGEQHQRAVVARTARSLPTAVPAASPPPMTTIGSVIAPPSGRA